MKGGQKGRRGGGRGSHREYISGAAGGREAVCQRQEGNFDPRFDLTALNSFRSRRDWKATPFASDAVKD